MFRFTLREFRISSRELHIFRGERIGKHGVRFEIEIQSVTTCVYLALGAGT